jgi:uncharacterized membrane protein YjjB (DUF3815 family)
VSAEWFAQTIVAAAITAAVSLIVISFIGWLWGRRKLAPFLRRHAPALLAMLAGRDDQ